MLILAAFDSSIAAGSTLVDCKSITDAGVLTQSGDGYVIDKRMKKLLAAWGFGANLTRIQIQTPTFAQIAQEEVTGIMNAAPAGNALPHVSDLRAVARDLSETETLIAQVIQGGGVAENDRVFVLVGDAVPAPVAKQGFTIRFTMSTTLTADAWTNGALTLSSNLPKGSYQVIGARLKSAGALAFRIRFVGAADAPGAPAAQSDLASDWAPQRHGGLGAWGQFDQNLPPTIDVLSTSADTSESGELDLVKVG